MSPRLPPLLVVLLALCAAFPVAAGAAVKANVKRVILDYRNDGRIDPCRHSTKDLRDTLKVISADTEQYAPDFPRAIEAALEARARGDCDKRKRKDGDGSAAAAPPPPPAPAPPPPAPAPPPPAPPAAEAVPEPPAPPPGAGIAPGAPPPAETRPDVVLTRPLTGGSDASPVPLIVVGALLAACLLAAALLLLMRRLGWGERRLAGVRHAVGEATFRTGGTWQNFTDWVRLGG